MLIGYMRVSTDTDKQTTDLQKDALLKAGVDERHLFSDYASGMKDDRAGLKSALEYLKTGDCLVVWKLDRLGRSLPNLIEIVNNLKNKGVGFKSLTENMDTTTPQGELFFHIFGSLAQYERALIRERIMAGLQASRSRGKKSGRPRVIDDERLKVILTALENGQSKASICRTFQIPRTTLHDCLTRNKREAVKNDLSTES